MQETPFLTTHRIFFHLGDLYISSRLYLLSTSILHNFRLLKFGGGPAFALERCAMLSHADLLDARLGEFSPRSSLAPSSRGGRKEPEAGN